MNASDFQRVVFTLTRTPHTVENPARHCNNTKLLLHQYFNDTLPATVERVLRCTTVKKSCELLDSNDCNLQNDIRFVETLFVGFDLLPRITYLLLRFL